MAQPETATLRAGLRQNHRKLTRARQVVLDILTRAQRHLTPAEIYRQAKTRHSQLGLTTVYRTLDLLVDLGYVQRVHALDGCQSYAPSIHAHSHQLVCSQCGRAEEFGDCDLEMLIRALQRKTGFQINAHMLELVGRCPACQTRARKGRTRAAPRARGKRRKIQ